MRFYIFCCLLSIMGCVYLHPKDYSASATIVFNFTNPRTNEKTYKSIGIIYYVSHFLHSNVSGRVVLTALENGNYFGCLPNAYAGRALQDPWIALVEQGNCTYVEKIYQAALANASGIIMYDSVTGSILILGIADQNDFVAVNVPCDNGLQVKNEILSGSLVTVDITTGDSILSFSTRYHPMTSVIFVSSSVVIIYWLLVTYFMHRFLILKTSNSAQLELKKIISSSLQSWLDARDEEIWNNEIFIAEYVMEDSGNVENPPDEDIMTPRGEANTNCGAEETFGSDLSNTSNSTPGSIDGKERRASESGTNFGSGLIMRYPDSNQPNYNPEQECASLLRNWRFGNITKEQWIKLQIFYDEWRNVKFLFWIGDVNKHDALFLSEGYIKSGPLPQSVYVNLQDKLQLHFMPDKKCSRFDDKNKSREVDLYEIYDQGYSMHGLVIYLDPKEIKDSYIVIHYWLSRNGEKLNWEDEIRLRIRERHNDFCIHPSKKLEAPHHLTASNLIYIISNHNQSETTIGMQVTDHATVHQDNKNCKTFFRGQHQL